MWGVATHAVGRGAGYGLLFGYVVDKNTGKMKTDGSVPDEYTGEYKDID